MSALDEVKALGLAAFINFMIYYIVGSLLLVVGVNDVSKCGKMKFVSFFFEWTEFMDFSHLPLMVTRKRGLCN